MLDAVQPVGGDKEAARRLIGIDPGEMLLCLFPGSRPFELRTMLTFFLRTAEIVTQALNMRMRVIISLSPFINPNILATAAGETLPEMEGSVAVTTPQEELHSIPGVKTWSLTTGKFEVTAYQGCQYDCMLASDLALTVPGSNTMEMAYFGLPMVVALPLHRVQDIPLEGLPGLVGKVPMVGPLIKEKLVRRLATRIKYTALPNRRAGKKVVPEVVGNIQPADLAIPLVELAKQPQKRTAVSEELRRIAGAKGAAEKLAEIVVNAAGQIGEAKQAGQAERPERAGRRFR
jgi:lipid A disaccharide synthetase